MQSVSTNNGRQVLLALVQTVQENSVYLSEIDGAIGDGDHGINMNKGFSLFKERMDESCDDLGTALRMLADVLLIEIGGSMGPIYGTFFRRLAQPCANKKKIDPPLFGRMLRGAVEGVMDIGGAQRGDKTILDTMIPALEAYDSSLAAGASFEEALHAMMEAAEKGKNATRDMVAKLGRSSRLGERSRGVLDAGAVSCNLILQALGTQFLLLMVE